MRKLSCFAFEQKFWGLAPRIIKLNFESRLVVDDDTTLPHVEDNRTLNGADGRGTRFASRQSRLGWARYTPLVLFPATGPSHCVAPAYALHSAAGDRKGFHLCGDLAFGPSHLIRRSCIIYLRRFRLFAAVHPTYISAGCLCEGAKRKLDTCGA